MITMSSDRVMTDAGKGQPQRHASDYARVARAIRIVVSRHPEEPDLDGLAAEVGLSPFHFQRLFTAYVGMSPKRFSQYLFLREARERLARGETVLQAALEAGLSGPGRLHDLVVTCEALTPGELRARGQGLDITFGWAESPFGGVVLARTPRGICHLAFEENPGEDDPPEGLRERFRRARFHRDDEAAADLAERVFRGGSPLVLHIRGTNFQIQVWQALLAIPDGAATTYGQLAKAVGRPSAARAVGQAVGANPIGYVIPCHRVLRESGALGGYHWGGDRKRALLAMEWGRRTDSVA